MRTVCYLTMCAAALSAQTAMADPLKEAAGAVVHANVVGLDGASLGTVTLQDTPTGVLVTADLKGLPEGDHGFHFHEKGVCDPATKFDSAGGHLPRVGPSTA